MLSPGCSGSDRSATITMESGCVRPNPSPKRHRASAVVKKDDSPWNQTDAEGNSQHGEGHYILAAEGLKDSAGKRPDNGHGGRENGNEKAHIGFLQPAFQKQNRQKGSPEAHGENDAECEGKDGEHA